MTKALTPRAAILPRLIRHRDAPGYLGMDRNRFDAEVRPDLTEIPLGARAIAFDRLDLDAWADAYKAKHGRPGRSLAKEAPARPSRATDHAPQPAAPLWKPPPSGKKRSAFDRAMETCFGRPGSPPEAG